MSRILVIEDDPHLAEGLEYNLVRAGYEARIARTAAQGRSAALEWAPDLVLLDLMLPDQPGFELLRELVERGSPFPIFVLSARAQEADKLRGFDLGAVDYLTKPFSIGELLARIRVRLQERSNVDRFALGELRIDLGRFVIEGGKRAVHLTPTEVALLRELRREPGRPVAREALLARIWNLGGGMTRTLDAHIARLRRKLELDPASPRHLLTVRGIGYVLRTAAEEVRE
jgi:DNA-binding response OmpR family regulator